MVNKKVRILAITNRVPYPLKDGGNIATFQMLESMLHCGYEVKLLSLNTNKHFVDNGSLPPIFEEMKLETVKINTDITFKEAFRNLFSGKSYNAVRFYKEEFRNLIQKTLLDMEYDIVHFENIYTALYIDTVKANSKAKCVLRPHNIEYEIWERAASNESFLKRKYIQLLAGRLKKFEIEHWRKFDAIIPIAFTDEITIKENNLMTTNYLTLPTAIDVKNVEANNQDSNINAVFHLGSMEWIPNQQAMEWFINNVWEQIAKETKASFYMAGRNMPESFFNYESESIKVIGEVEDAKEFMRDKQIMVVPLFAGSGVRIKILEGMAAGKTIITTSLGVQGIDAFDKEQLLIANNLKAFADAVIWCVKNERKSRELGNRARKFIEEKYSMESFESKLNVFLSKILNN